MVDILYPLLREDCASVINALMGMMMYMMMNMMMNILLYSGDKMQVFYDKYNYTCKYYNCT